MMSVMVIESTHYGLALVRFVVAIRIGKKNEVVSLCNINAFRCKFETCGKMQSFCKNDFLVRLAVQVSVLKDDEFIVGLWITRLVMRVARHG